MSEQTPDPCSDDPDSCSDEYAADVPTGLERGVLFVVATPIGNLSDISRRAVDVLGQVALIAAEDTRRTRSLLTALGLKAPRMLALHDHNEATISARIRQTLAEDRSVALVSDAGTPLLSDPGFALVRSCFEAGIKVQPVPGPSAVVAAMSVCPLPTTDSQFVGFLPAKAVARRRRLKALLDASWPVVFFEAPHRLRDCLHEIGQLEPGRRIFVAREMTKLYETCLCGSAAELIDWMDRDDQWRGEMVCILEGAGQRTADVREQERVMQILCQELAPAQAARLGALLLGTTKSVLYTLAQALKDSSASP